MTATDSALYILQGLIDSQRAAAQVTSVQTHPSNGFVWGANMAGCQGRNDSTGRSSPVVLPGQWLQFSASVLDAATYNSPIMSLAGIRANQTLWTCGSNAFGQLGLGSTTGYSTLQQVPGSWSMISVGDQFMAGIRTDQSLWVWGSGASGELGTGSLANVSSPVQLAGNYSSVATGSYFAGAIKTNGELWIWGYGASGELGQNSTLSKSSPVQVAGSWTQIALGDEHVVAIKSDGTLWTWGINTYGQLGDNTIVNKKVPTQISTSSHTWVAAAINTSMAIKADGTLWGWGSGYKGVLGVAPTELHVPTQIFAGTTWSKISVGTVNQNYGTNKDYAYALGIKTDGTLWSWGYNASGQLGLSDLVDRSSPVQIPGSWIQASAGSNFAAAIRKQSG